MALIQCSECKREISDKAAACPHCGCPVSATNKSLSMNPVSKQGVVPRPQTVPVVRPTYQPTKVKRKRKNGKKTFGIVTVILVVLLLFVLISTHIICLFHDYSKATVLEPQTCDYCGKTQGEPKPLMEIDFPTAGVGALLPLPESNMGEVNWYHHDSFSMYVGNTTYDDYSNYINKCMEAGFNINFHQYEDSFSAYDSNGNDLNIYFRGNDIIEVYIHTTGSMDVEKIDDNEQLVITEQEVSVEQQLPTQIENVKEDYDNIVTTVTSYSDMESEESFISNGCFTFSARSFIKLFDEADKEASGYNYTYMKMNGETLLFYELAEISGGYESVKSVGMVSFVKDIDTTLTIEEDYTENIITKINVLVEDVNDVPPILVGCMCAADPALDFTTAYNLGMDVVEQAGTEEGYTYNGINYIVSTDNEYYYIIISVSNTSADNEDAITPSSDDSSYPKEPTNKNPTHITATLTATETDLYLDGTSQLVYFYVNPSNIDAIVDYTIADESIVEIQRGGWGGNTAQLLFIPVTTGETTVTVYINGYEGCSVKINISTNVGDGVSSGFDFEAPFITSTESEFYLENENGVTYITAHNITGEYSLSYDVNGSDVVECLWGDWDGDTISLTFIPLDSGNAFVTVYIDGYYDNSSITIPVFVP